MAFRNQADATGNLHQGRVDPTLYNEAFTGQARLIPHFLEIPMPARHQSQSDVQGGVLWVRWPPVDIKERRGHPILYRTVYSEMVGCWKVTNSYNTNFNVFISFLWWASLQAPSSCHWKPALRQGRPYNVQQGFTGLIPHFLEIPMPARSVHIHV